MTCFSTPDIRTRFPVSQAGTPCRGREVVLQSVDVGELRERSAAEDVGDGARVPALGEHGDRHHAAGRAPEPARYASTPPSRLPARRRAATVFRWLATSGLRRQSGVSGRRSAALSRSRCGKLEIDA